MKVTIDTAFIDRMIAQATLLQEYGCKGGPASKATHVLGAVSYSSTEILDYTFF